jgi:hypothetical protein
MIFSKKKRWDISSKSGTDGIFDLFKKKKRWDISSKSGTDGIFDLFKKKSDGILAQKVVPMAY